MRKNLLKNMMLALLLTAAVPTLTAQVHVGDILCEGNAIISPANYSSSGATAIGVVFYVDNTGQHGWVVALEDEGEYAWGGYGTMTSMPHYSNRRQAIYDLDGYKNTLIVRQHSTDHPAFYAVDFEDGWYVPAIGQLNYLYGNLVEVNSSLQVVGGSLFPSVGWLYWSSSEVGNYWVWILGSNGELFYSADNEKNQNYHVRAVKNF